MHCFWGGGGFFFVFVYVGRTATMQGMWMQGFFLNSMYITRPQHKRVMWLPHCILLINRNLTHYSRQASTSLWEAKMVKIHSIKTKNCSNKGCVAIMMMVRLYLMKLVMHQSPFFMAFASSSTCKLRRACETGKWLLPPLNVKLMWSFFT